MFGSLAIIYPTPHEGGELTLHHKDHEWRFNANSLASLQPSHSLAYIAFSNDIEHEVLKVTSGHRVTVTYNLYMVDPVLKPEAPVITPSLKNTLNLQVALQGLLKSLEFLPDGGTLCFGLTHLYPITSKTELWEMANHLKGTDTHMYQTC